MKDVYIKLNQRAHKVVIRDQVEFIWHKPTKLSDISISDKHCTVSIFGRPLLKWDKHLHYPKAAKHPIASFLFLQAVTEALEASKPRSSVKEATKKLLGVSNKIEFYSNCYTGDETRFLIAVEELSEGKSEAQVAPLVEPLGGYRVSEDIYSFRKPRHTIHHQLESLGFIYKGPVDSDAIDTGSPK